MPCKGIGRTDTQKALTQELEAFDSLLGLAYCADGGCYHRIKLLGFDRGCDRPLATQKQLHAEHGFKLLYRLADSALRNEKLPSRLGKRAIFIYRRKHTVQVEGEVFFHFITY